MKILVTGGAGYMIATVIIEWVFKKFEQRLKKKNDGTGEKKK